MPTCYRFSGKPGRPQRNLRQHYFLYSQHQRVKESGADPALPLSTIRRHIMSITPIERVLYTAKAHTTGGREGGASRTSDGRLDVKFSVPGGPGNGTNPEELFAVGWSACFLSAVKLVAQKMKVKLPADVAIDPEVDLLTGSDGYFLKARLNVNLPGVD